MPFLRHEPICKTGSGRQTGIKENRKEQARTPSNSSCSASAGWEYPVFCRNGQRVKETVRHGCIFRPSDMRNILKSARALQPHTNGSPRGKRLLPEISHDIISRRFCSVSCLYRQSSYRRETWRFPYIVKSILSKQRTGRSTRQRTSAKQKFSFSKIRHEKGRILSDAPCTNHTAGKLIPGR